MKIVQVNAVRKVGSTGRTMTEFSDYMTANGHLSYEVYGVGKKESENEFICVNRFGYLVHNFLAKFFGNQGGYSYYATKRLIRWIDEIKPDVVHIRNLYGNFLNYRMFFHYLSTQKKTAVVLTTHDFFFFTGNCTFPKCENFEKGCTECHAYKRNKYNWIFIRSAELFKKKQNYFLSLPRFGVQCNSFYSKRVMSKSFMKNMDNEVIYNWIDKNKFFPESNLSIFGFERKKPVVITVWASLDETNERFVMLIRVAKEMAGEADFVAIGKNKLNKKKYPYLHIFDGTNSTYLLRTYYSSADLMFNPSTTDSFGKVVAECQMCGTPAVVYNSQSLPELVEDGCGEIAYEYTVESAIEAIRKVISNGKAYYSDNCIKKAAMLYDLESNCGKLEKFYQSLLNRQEDEDGK